MLQAIGLSSFRELYGDVPAEMYLDRPLEIPSGMSELEAGRAVRAMAAKNRVYDVILRGAGAYDHYIPSIVKYIPAKEEFLTAYTPYQAEMSQGLLQSIFEYQTMICMLTGMDVSNASVYDGATAAAEAAAMCRDRKRRVTLVSATTHPDVINTIRTYCYGTGDELRIVPEKDGKTDPNALREMLTADTASFYVQQPNFHGLFEDAEALGAWLQGMAEDAQNFAVTAFDGETVVGDLGIQRIRAHIKIQHRASLGISLQAAYCGCGLGRAMLQIAVAQARENGFEQIELGVFADNVRAIHLYQSLGFEDFGCTPRAFRLKDGTYHDERMLVKFL